MKKKHRKPTVTDCVLWRLEKSPSQEKNASVNDYQKQLDDGKKFAKKLGLNVRAVFGVYAATPEEEDKELKKMIAYMRKHELHGLILHDIGKLPSNPFSILLLSLITTTIYQTAEPNAELTLKPFYQGDPNEFLNLFIWGEPLN